MSLWLICRGFDPADLPTASKEEVEVAARKLLERGVKEAILVKRGKSGSLLVTKDNSIEQNIFKTEKVLRSVCLLPRMMSF